MTESISNETAREYAAYLTRDTHNPFGALRAMLGTRLIIRTETGIRFDLHGALHRVTLCALDYDAGLDLFKLRFYKNKRFEGNVVVKEFDALFFDQLKEVFEEYTGLFLSFRQVFGLNA